MPVSKELRKLLEENKLNKKRPTGATWTCGKRWDRIQTVKKNLEKLHLENEVQYAVFLAYPNPKGDPSHYLYFEGEEIQKLVEDQITFSKSFLELQPKWTNPPTFVSTENSGRRKRCHNLDNAEGEQSEEKDLPATPHEETSIPPAEDNRLSAGSHLNHNVAAKDLFQEENASFENQEKAVFCNPTDPEQTEMSNEKHFLKGLKQDLYVEKQKKYRQAKSKAQKQFLPKVKRKQSEDPSGTDQRTSSKQTKRQKSQGSFASTMGEDQDLEGTGIHENCIEETQTVILCFNLGEDETLHLETTDCQGIA